MNKIFIVAVIFVMPFLIGCKKSFVCVCTEFYNGSDTSWTKERGKKVIVEKKEKNAEAECDKLDGETQVYMTEEYGLDCKLK